MSPRAACRLFTLGFEEVYDYTAGKVDWLAAGLPTEGPGARTLRAGAIVRRDIPVCRLTDSLATIRTRLSESTEDRCVVLSDSDVVLGTITRDAAANASSGTAADVMRPGPATVRAHEELSPLATRMREHKVDAILVSDPDGVLIGLVHVEDAEAALR